MENDSSLPKIVKVEGSVVKEEILLESKSAIKNTDTYTHLLFSRDSQKQNRSLGDGSTCSTNFKQDVETDERSKISKPDPNARSLQEKNNFFCKQSVDVCSHFLEGLSENIKGESPEVLFQVEMRNEDCDNFVEEIELPLEQLQGAGDDSRSRVSSAMIDHDYVSAELSSHISLMVRIKTCDDMAKFLAMFSKFTSDFTPDCNFASKKEEIKCYVNELQEKARELSLKIDAIESENNQNENECDNKMSSKDNMGVFKTKFEADKIHMNCNRNWDSGEDEHFISRTLEQNCSEPLEFETAIIPNTEQTNAITNGVTLQNERLVRFNRIAEIGENISRISKSILTEENSNSEKDLKGLYVELKNYLYFSKTIGVQADLGKPFDFDSNEKKLNEKEKRKLLSRLSSSSETDSSRDDEEVYSGKSSKSYMSASRSSLSSKFSDDEDENNNFDEGISPDDEKEPKSIDLSSYVVKGYCESQFDSGKTMDTTPKQGNLDDGLGRRRTDIDHLEQQNLNPTSGEEDKLEQRQALDNLEKVKSGEDTQDKEIDKLLDFSTIMKKNSQKGPSESGNSCEKEKRKSTKKESICTLANDVEKYLSTDETSSEEESERITEREFLEKYNSGYKHKLLNTSSSESEQGSDVSDVDVLLENISSSVTEKETSKKTEKEPAQKSNIMELGDLLQENECFRSAPSPVANIGTPDIANSNNDTCFYKGISKGNSPIEESKKDQINEEQSLLLPAENRDSNENDKKNSLLHREDTEMSDCELLNAETKEKKNLKPEDGDENLISNELPPKRPKSVDNSIDVSSDTESDITNEENADEVEKTKRTIKPMLRQDQLAGETKKAQQNEDQRLKRLKKKRELLSKMLKEHEESLGISEDNLILDYNSTTKTFIKVHSGLVTKLKPHQIEGVKFMYDAVFGSVDNLQKYPGSGCILAHCMGLGKTLQLIALLHTVISYKELNTSKVLVLCPKSTVMNWIDEIKFWLEPLNCKDLKLYKFESREYGEKLRILREWSSCGKPGFRNVGCLLVGYEAFRMLASCHNHKKQRDNLSLRELQNMEEDINKTLFDPGPDLVICDEGHIIKNRKSATSAAVLKLKTPRRIILTGTPIQNNLKEYYSMVNFIKPSFLGTEREFANMYANPIKNGQHKDSNKLDIKIMKQRSFVLHKKLSEFVQRKEAALLKTFLPEKYEYVLFIPMTEVQIQLYEYFLQTIAKRDDSRGKNLITDYTCLRKIWTHPKVLENAWQNANAKSRSSVRTNNSDDEAPDDVLDSQTGFLSVKRDWWRHLVCPDDLASILPSNKLRIVFEILRLCQETNEKCLIFSAFVAVLNVLEYFLKQIGKDGIAKEGIKGHQFKGPWLEGRDFYRLDGKTPKNRRHEMIKNFNKPNNPARCFLISARAGGQGINLIGANRVILLDTSWNPSNDQQNIFRIFRLGQKRKCYIYRLLAMGTMEEKVYSRSVTKQAMSFRVVDEQQIDRHYSMAELAELYSLTKPDYKEREVPKLPQDSFLASLLRNYPNLIYKYHEHDSLLENKVEQELSEQEKQDAWAAYEKDLQQSQNPPGMFPSPFDGLSNTLLGHNAANYFSSLPHLNYNNYSLNPANLLPWSGIDYTSTALASFYSMCQGLQPGSSPLLSNQNLLNMQPQFSNNVLSSEASSRPFSCIGPYGALTSSTPNSNAITSAMFPGISSLPTVATKNSTTDFQNSARYFSNSAFGTQISSSATNNANVESRVQNQQPGLQSSLNKNTISATVTTCTLTTTNTPSITTDATRTTSTSNSKEQKGTILEISKSKVGSRGDPTTFLNSSSDIQITSITPKTSPANSLASLEVSRGTKASNMGIVYPPVEHPHTKATNSKTLSNSFLTSKVVDLATSSIQGGNISVRSVSAINNGSANKTIPAQIVKGLGVTEKKIQKTVKTSSINIDKRTTNKEAVASKPNIKSNNTSALTANVSPSTIVVSSSMALQKPSSLTVSSLPASLPSKTLVKRINTTPQVTKTMNSGMIISSSPMLASINSTRSNDTNSSALPSVKSSVTDSTMQKRSKINSEISTSKTKLTPKINQLEKSVFPKPNLKSLNPVKCSSQLLAVDDSSINTKQLISNHATGPIQIHTVTPKQSNNSGFVRVVNVPTSSNTFKHMNKTNKSEAVLRNIASVPAKSPQLFNKMSETLNAVGKKTEISIRPVEILNKLTNHGLTASSSRKLNLPTTPQNSLNASHCGIWKADASRKRSLPTNSSVLPDGSFSGQRKKPRLVDVFMNNEKSKVQLSQGAHVRKDVQLSQRTSAVSVKPPEVVEID